MGNPSEDLSDVQAWMQSTLLDPQNANDPSLIEHFVTPSETLTAQQRLAIYQRSYYSRLIECMHSHFTALLYTLGNELFDDFARMYIQQCPSQSPSLGYLGEQFPAFLEATRPDKEAPEMWINFMIAMAQFEVDLYIVYDQEGSEGMQFANELTEDKNLEIQACFALHQYPFDVNWYFQQVSEENNPEITLPEETYIAFVRSKYQVRIVSLTNIQFVLLGLINDGVSIDEALVQIIQQYNIAAEEIAEMWLEWKQDWIIEGFFLEKIS